MSSIEWTCKYRFSVYARVSNPFIYVIVIMSGIHTASAHTTTFPAFTPPSPLGNSRVSSGSSTAGTSPPFIAVSSTRVIGIVMTLWRLWYWRDHFVFLTNKRTVPILMYFLLFFRSVELQQTKAQSYPANIKVQGRQIDLYLEVCLTDKNSVTIAQILLIVIRPVQTNHDEV